MKKNLAVIVALVIAAILSTGVYAGEKKSFKIATDTVFKPFEYPDESGNQIGIDMEILAAIAEDQGFEYTLDVLGWDASIAACQAKRADGMIAGASITDERKESVLFSVPYHGADLLLIPRKTDLGIAGGNRAEPDKGFFRRLADSFVKNFIRESRWKLILQGIGTTCFITFLSVIAGSLVALLICLFRRTESL